MMLLAMLLRYYQDLKPDTEIDDQNVETELLAAKMLIFSRKTFLVV